MRNGLDRTNLLQNADLVRSSPTFLELCIRVKLGDLHTTDLDFLSGWGNAVERTLLRPGNRIGKCDVVLICHQMLNRDLEVRKSGVELREPMNKPIWPRPLIVRRIVVLYPRCHDLV